MRSILATIVLSLLIITACNSFTKKQSETPPPDTIHVKSAEELLAEEQARQDSIKQAEYEQMQQTPFGDLRFGMGREEVSQKNEKRQQLGKYSYNFTYSFTPENQLYKVIISSDGVKTINYDSALKANYQNLLDIITAKYGDPETKSGFPSIFDVQDAKKYSVNKWSEGTKQIQLLLVENNMNSYAAVCEIFDQNTNSAEQERIKNAKNRDVIEASEKF